MMFHTSVEETVKGVSVGNGMLHTSNSYYKPPTSDTVALPHIKISKPSQEEITRNEHGR